MVFSIPALRKTLASSLQLTVSYSRKSLQEATRQKHADVNRGGQENCGYEHNDTSHLKGATATVAVRDNALEDGPKGTPREENTIEC